MRSRLAVLALVLISVATTIALVRCTTGESLLASIPGGWWGFGLILTVGGFLLAWAAGWVGRRQFEADRLGKYDLERLLGEGGMGQVYRATHRYLRRPTAVKLLPPDKVNDQTRARFEREVQETAQLQHPNTIAIYDYGKTSGGVFYYAMEFVPGMTLTEVVQQDGAQSVARTIHILRQVCGSLAEAHDRGLVHRDVKPSNVMVSRWGGVWDFVKVVDFGLVKVQDTPPDVQLTRSRVLLGTPEFLAPEAIIDPSEVDHRADLYGVGAVAYYLLSGRPVFQGGTTIALLGLHIEEPPDPEPITVDDPAGAELSKVVLACLAKDRNLRPESARQLGTRLEALASIAPWTQDAAASWWEADERRV